MDEKDIENLRQIIASLFQALRLQQGQIQKLSASGQALRDAIQAHDPELFRKFEALYPAIAKSIAEDNAPIIRLVEEQLAALKKMGHWMN